MKISVSLHEEDIGFLDDYAQVHGMPSRSATVRKAIRLLKAAQLADEYAEAFREWTDNGEAEVWETVVSDGLEPE